MSKLFGPKLRIVIPCICLCSCFNVVLAQTAMQSLQRVRQLESTVPTFFERAKSALLKEMPNLAVYEKSLPPFAKVIAQNDKQNLKNYGGLSEAYFYHDDPIHGQKLYRQFISKAPTMLDSNDTFSAQVTGDIGIYYFIHKQYASAKPLLVESTKGLEKSLNTANANNLVSNYLCLSLINDKEHKLQLAQSYAKKMADLIARQRASRL